MAEMLTGMAFLQTILPHLQMKSAALTLPSILDTILILPIKTIRKDSHQLMLTEQDLRQGLQTRSFGRKIYSFDLIDSTNECAKALANCSAAEGTIVFAEQQTAGKGRFGREWTADPNENLTFSIILRPELKLDSTQLLPLYVAVAVAEAVEESSGMTVECKWPNDLLVGGRKIAGFLLEASTRQNKLDFVVLGVGINVNQTRFPESIGEKATSLKTASGESHDRASLFRTVVKALEDHYARFSSSGFESVVAQWLSRSSMLNRRISVSMHGAPVSGIVKGLSREGGLILLTGGEERVLFAGDVSILEGYS
jgi:BirA family biotin operon repressor/biotin-[acetyl-CoA-carboxylase] ligase